MVLWTQATQQRSPERRYHQRYSPLSFEPETPVFIDGVLSSGLSRKQTQAGRRLGVHCKWEIRYFRGHTNSVRGGLCNRWTLRPVIFRHHQVSQMSSGRLWPSKPRSCRGLVIQWDHRSLLGIENRDGSHRFGIGKQLCCPARGWVGSSPCRASCAWWGVDEVTASEQLLLPYKSPVLRDQSYSRCLAEPIFHCSGKLIMSAQ